MPRGCGSTSVACLEAARLPRGESSASTRLEPWAFYTSGSNHLKSDSHSVILVDGEGQENSVPGKFVQYQDSAEATFGSMDARQAYGIKHFGGGLGQRDRELLHAQARALQVGGAGVGGPPSLVLWRAA